MNLGLGIRKIRGQCGLTQRELAQLLNVTIVHVSYIENGRRFPSADLVDRVLNVFELSKDELYFAALDMNKELPICDILKEFRKMQISRRPTDADGG